MSIMVLLIIPPRRGQFNHYFVSRPSPRVPGPPANGCGEAAGRIHCLAILERCAAPKGDYVLSHGRSAMLAKLTTYALVGIDAVPVEVEVDAAAGLPKIVLVGLPEMAVKESIHRIERAMANLGYQRPNGRTVINLAPADLRKDAGSFDLPIALGLLVATRQLTPDQVDRCASVGELALDGNVRPVRGALSMAMEARSRGIRRLVVPAESA